MPNEWNERALIDQLRNEAQGFKQCFTTFSFQSISIAVSVLGLSLGALKTYPYAAFAPLPLVALLIAVCRIGIFKYSSANRHAGYELHLARTREAGPPEGESRPGEWNQSMRTLPWEEAVRAWRIVQPTLFRQLYRTPDDVWMGRRSSTIASLNPFRKRLYVLRPAIRAAVDAYLSKYGRRSTPAATPFENGDRYRGDYPWFLPARLVECAEMPARRREAAVRVTPMYYAGSYLKNMLFVLVTVQVLMLVPLLVLIIGDVSGGAPLPTRTFTGTGVFVFVAAVIATRAVRLRRRRIIIEEELLSIHSCAIVWQAVVLAHFRALHVHYPNRYLHYTEALTREAVTIAAAPLRIHEWLEAPDEAV